ncbi:MAG: 50S ribosomal protein L23 [Candidatus Lernaella stagnicola]|nr:50S ribosomal protein L23 [Candidatus Lernaella stagnicola]
MKAAYKIIKRPVITEKANLAQEDRNKVTFEVALHANKVEIGKAVEELFDVTVEDVRTQVMPGKRKRLGRHIGYTPKWKKATVTLQKGDSIDFFEGV